MIGCLKETTTCVVAKPLVENILIKFFNLPPRFSGRGQDLKPDGKVTVPLPNPLKPVLS